MNTSNTGAVVLALALAAPGGTFAAPPPEPTQGEAVAREAGSDSAIAQAGKAAPEARLDNERGGDASITNINNKADLSGVVTGNTAINVTTGNNIIDAGSFANMSGIPMVIQNSGANVLIQNATVVNLQMR